MTAGAALASGAEILVAVRDAASKVVLPTTVADDPTAAIALDVARNETQSVQLVLQGNGRSLDAVSLRPERLAGPGGAEIPADGIDLFLVHHVAVDTPSDSRGRRGRWPDALVPFRAPARLRGDSPMVVWIRLHVPSSMPPGRYSGAVLIEIDGRLARRVPVTLQVYRAVLPDRPTLPFVVGFDYESIHRLDGDGLDPARFASRVLPAYYRALVDAGAAPFVLFDAMPKVSGRGAALKADFAPYDRRLAEIYGGRPQVPFPVPFGLSQPITAAMHAPFTSGWDAAVVAYLKQVAQHLRARGDLERAFIYLQEADEPTTRDHIGKIAHLHRLVRDADPRLRMVQTIHVRCFDCSEDPVALLDSEVTLWTPNIAFADGTALGVERALGGPRVRSFDSGWAQALGRRKRGADSEVWWYLNPATTVLPGPHAAYPSLHIDHDGMAHRALAWTAWSHRVDAVGHWMATFWRGAGGPWQRVPRGENDKGTNGDGVLIYPRSGAAAATGQPDPGGPTPSIRLELIREGGGDHKLMTLAEKAVGRRATEEIVRRVAPSIRQYVEDPLVLRSARRALLEAASR